MKKYFRIIYIVFKQLKEFMVNFVGQVIYFPVKFAILFLIWNYVYKNANTLLGYSFEEMLGYYYILAVVQTCIMPCGYVAYKEWETINSGKMNLYLTKPISYPVYVYVEKLGGFFIYLFVGTIFIYLTVLFMRMFGIEIVLGNYFIFFVSLFMSVTIMINLFTIVGHITFFVENILSLRDMLWNIIKIFSGEIFPVAMYPWILQKICKILPFQYIYFFPISLLQKKISGKEIFQSLAVQLIWCFILSGLNYIVWKYGKRKYVSQGG